MAENKIQCPACKAAMNSKTPLPAGTQVKCPKCKKPFKVAAPKPADKPKAKAKAQADAPTGDALAFDAPGGGVTVPAYARHRAGPPKIVLLLGGCFGFLLLAALGTGIGVYLYFQEPAESPKLAKGNPKKDVAPVDDKPKVDKDVAKDKKDDAKDIIKIKKDDTKDVIKVKKDDEKDVVKDKKNPVKDIGKPKTDGGGKDKGELPIKDKTPGKKIPDDPKEVFEWKEHAVAYGGFAVQLPQAPLLDDGKIVVAAGDIHYQIRWFDTQTRTSLAAAIKSNTANPQFHLEGKPVIKNTKPITFMGEAGTEFEVEQKPKSGPTLTYRCRLISQQTRVYYVLAGCGPESAKMAEIDRFFESFRVMPELITNPKVNLHSLGFLHRVTRPADEINLRRRWGPAISHDGAYVAYLDVESHFNVINLKSRTKVKLNAKFSGDDFGNVGSYYLLSDGKLLASHEGKTALVDSKGSTPLDIKDGEILLVSGTPARVLTQAQGKLFVHTLAGPMTGVPLQSKQLARAKEKVKKKVTPGTPVRMSNDGSKIAVLWPDETTPDLDGDTVAIYDSADGKFLFNVPDVLAGHFTFSGDSQHLIVAEIDGIQVWSIQDGKKVRTLPWSSTHRYDKLGALYTYGKDAALLFLRFETSTRSITQMVDINTGITKNMMVSVPTRNLSPDTQFSIFRDKVEHVSSNMQYKIQHSLGDKGYVDDGLFLPDGRLLLTTQDVGMELFEIQMK